MKPKFALRSFLAITGSSLLAISYSHAATKYWDGDTVNGGNPAANANGGAGDWDNALTNWDTLAAGGADVAWIASDTAVFGGSTGIVTLTDNVTVGGMQFNTTAYLLDAATNTKTLSFASGANTILFNNIAAATITGTVAGSGSNLILSASNPATAGTLTFNDTSAGGWSGTTTIGAGMTLLWLLFGQGIK